MGIVFWVLIVLLALAALMLFAIAPSAGRKRADSWRGTVFAHRGLFGEGASENGLKAFERACEGGWGIELDVGLTRDGETVIFHDDDLKRMLGDARMLEDVSFDELRAMRLPDGGVVPTLDEVLKLVDGRVPLLVELKNMKKKNNQLCRKTLAQLKTYRGAFVVESFSPMIVYWFRRNAPELIRGQLVNVQEDYLKEVGKGAALLLCSLAFNFLARPDFVAYNVNEPFTAPRLQRKLFNTPLACWTVRSQAVFDEVHARGEMPIFEGFLPRVK